MAHGDGSIDCSDEGGVPRGGAAAELRNDGHGQLVLLGGCVDRQPDMVGKVLGNRSCECLSAHNHHLGRGLVSLLQLCFGLALSLIRQVGFQKLDVAPIRECGVGFFCDVRVGVEALGKISGQKLVSEQRRGFQILFLIDWFDGPFSAEQVDEAEELDVITPMILCHLAECLPILPDLQVRDTENV